MLNVNNVADKCFDQIDNARPFLLEYWQEDMAGFPRTIHMQI